MEYIQNGGNNDYQLLVPGTYHGKIIRASEFPTKIEITWLVNDVVQIKETLTPAVVFKLDQLCIIMGKPVIPGETSKISTGDLIDLEASLEINHREYNGKTYNNIKKYLPVDVSFPPPENPDI